MSTETDTQEQTISAEEWFGGGQVADLQRISGIKDPEKKKAALQQFNELNNAFLEERAAGERAGFNGKARSHPAVDAAIDAAIDFEKGWVKDIGGMSDDQLRDRYLDRLLKQDVIRNRVDPHVTLPEYKAAQPDLVELAGKYTRSDLERKEVLSRMIQDRRFNVSKCKVEYERKQNPELVAIAEKNLAGRRLPGGKYNDSLFAEIKRTRETLGNAKKVGFKL